MSRIGTVVFDAYGTLLDVHAAMAKHAERLGPDWPRISHDWRTKQLEYTWVRSLAGPAQHRDLFALTREALDWTAARHGIADQALLADVLDAYRVLGPYPDVTPALEALRARGIARAILSNGAPGMLADAVAAGGLAGLLDAVLSVEAAGVFKPDRRVYALATERFFAQPAEVAFVSSNAWDAFGAHAFGFQVFWLNRARQPDEYGLRGTVRELSDLAGLAEAIA